MQPKVNYPAAQIIASASSALLSTGASSVITVPRTAGGQKPAFIRIAVSQGSAYAQLVANTSVSATTSGSVVNASEALWLNTLGLGFVAFLQVNPGGVAVASVGVCEEGAIGGSQSATSGLG